MTSCRGDLERTLDVFLPFDFGKVGGDEERLGGVAAVGLIRLDETTTRQMVVKIRKRSDGIDFQAGDQSRFGRVGFGDEHPLESFFASGHCHGQDATCVPDNAIQRKFPNHQCAFDRLGREAPGKNDDAERNGQVVGRSFFADGSGGKVDDDAVAGKV